jgi:hypothetical protein
MDTAACVANIASLPFWAALAEHWGCLPLASINGGVTSYVSLATPDQRLVVCGNRATYERETPRTCHALLTLHCARHYVHSAWVEQHMVGEQARNEDGSLFEWINRGLSWATVEAVVSTSRIEVRVCGWQ